MTKKYLNLVLFGGPGAGKGTLSQSLIEKYHLIHIAPGDMLRQHIKNQTEIGLQVQDLMNQGQLVPSTIVVNLVSDRIQTALQDPKTGGFIFDGVARKPDQAESLIQILKQHDLQLDYVIDLQVPDEELIKRLINRGQTSGRSDDTHDIIRNRLLVYYQETAPTLKWFRDHQVPINQINGVGPISEVYQRLEQVIKP